MAKATVVSMVTEVTLQLAPVEAKALRSLLGDAPISGGPLDSVFDAMKAAGIERDHSTWDVRPI